MGNLWFLFIVRASPSSSSRRQSDHSFVLSLTLQQSINNKQNNTHTKKNIRMQARNALQFSITLRFPLPLSFPFFSALPASAISSCALLSSNFCLLASVNNTLDWCEHLTHLPSWIAGSACRPLLVFPPVGVFSFVSLLPSASITPNLELRQHSGTRSRRRTQEPSC